MSTESFLKSRTICVSLGTFNWPVHFEFVNCACAIELAKSSVLAKSSMLAKKDVLIINVYDKHTRLFWGQKSFIEERQEKSTNGRQWLNLPVKTAACLMIQLQAVAVPFAE